MIVKSLGNVCASIVFIVCTTCILWVGMHVCIWRIPVKQKGTEPAEVTNLGLLSLLNSDTHEITLKETQSPETSGNDTFWLNSGGSYFMDGTFGRTEIGDIPTYSRWRLLYARTNPTDTDKGYHPQNIFRLVTKQTALNVVQQMYILVEKDNVSESLNRNESNGIFFFSRYQDGDDLYYTGIRVDGTAVIKKKFRGIYHTLAQVPVFKGDEYEKNIHPSMIPKGKWIGIRAEVTDVSTNVVNIKLYLDAHNTGIWKKVLDVNDTDNFDTPTIKTPGRGGIRTDFMDVRFKDYSFNTL